MHVIFWALPAVQLFDGTGCQSRCMCAAVPLEYQVVEEKRPGQYMPVYEDEMGSYIFNSKDLCMIAYIPQLLQCGVDSFKIEGACQNVLLHSGHYERIPLCGKQLSGRTGRMAICQSSCMKKFVKSATGNMILDFILETDGCCSILRIRNIFEIGMYAGL